MPAAPGIDGLRIEVVGSIDDFLALKPQWDSLAASMERAVVFFTHDWIRIWIESFAADKPLYIILVHDGPQLIGILPLYKEIYFTLKIFRQVCLHSLTNSCSAVSGVIARQADMARVLEAVVSFLGREQRHFSRVILEFVPSDLGVVEPLQQACAKGWAQISVKPWNGSYYLDIDGDFEAYSKGLGKSSRKNLRQKTNWMEKEGGVRREVCQDYDPEVFQRFLDLEDTGWKKELGRPIKCCPKSSEFYRCVARTFGPKGQFLMLSLFVNNKPAAMYCVVTHNGTGHALKNAVNYDEQGFVRFSPGQMISQDMIRAFFERGLKRLDFYGCCYPYQSHWADKVNRKHEITILKRSDFLSRLCFWAKDRLKKHSSSCGSEDGLKKI
ncbi:MAG: GNAT family N-acetyltransferase [Candidatus Omnitrophota bacterium]